MGQNERPAVDIKGNTLFIDRIVMSRMPPPPAFLENQVQELERNFRCYVSIHDHWGRLVTPEGTPFFTNRTLHRSPCCRWRRLNADGFDRRCVAHCKTAIHQVAQYDPSPFISSCWKGLTEVVVPLYSASRLQATCYAGPFRMKNQPPPDFPGIQSEYLELWNAIPERSPDECGALIRRIQLLGLAMIKLLDVPEPDAAIHENQRKSLILRFVRDNAEKNMQLKDLAKYLRLSTSRSSHLVRELFGQPFARVLRDERIRRATALLRNRELTISEIAEKSGFCNEYYFNRVFRQKTGITPGSFRRNYSLQALD